MDLEKMFSTASRDVAPLFSSPEGKGSVRFTGFF